MAVDCDRDALLIQAKPKGPTCHKGDDTCWGESNTPHYGFLSALEELIADRKNNPSDKSYVASLFAKGINKIAQKVGEEAVDRGAGELLFTSMNHDGTKQGFANTALRQLSETVTVPVIASGGAGTMQHFIDTFVEGNADAALAASVFHFKEISIPELKNELRLHKIPMR